MKREAGDEGGAGAVAQIHVAQIDTVVAPPDPMMERFRIPALPEGFLDRPRLYDDLELGVNGRLTLVSAPAGSGKTTLVSAWASRAREERLVVWVTIQGEDATRSRFWSTFTLGLGLHGVDTPMPPAQAGSDEIDGGYLDQVASALLKREALELAKPLVVILDCEADLSAEVADDLGAVLRQSAGWLRLVVLTRVDPLLPLHRYRLAGTLVEVRMADLAFTVGEARELMAQAGVRLPDAALRAIVDRTQGWAAGLRFAADFLSQRGDQERAALGFRGDTGNVADYLIAEVLDGQPASQREFLLETSIVDVLRPGLIEAVAGPQAHRALVLLARGNAFLGELSDYPGWYRYQPVFHDLLRAQLDIELPTRVPELHRAAAAWIFEHGHVESAVRHSAEAGDWEGAARYVIHDLAIGRLLLPGKDALTALLARMPDDTKGAPAALVRAALAMASYDLEACEEHLLRAEGQLDGARAARVGEEGLALQTVRLSHAAAVADVEGGLSAAVAAERLIQRQDTERVDEHPELLALIESTKGRAWLMRGDLDAAVEAFSAGARAADQPGCEVSLVQCLGHLALLAAVRGELRKAVDLASRVAELQQGRSDAIECPSAAVALAWVKTDLYDLQAARRYVQRASESVAVADDPTLQVVLALVDARVRRAHGDVEGAFARIAAVRPEIPAPLQWLREMLSIEEAELNVANGHPALAVQLMERLSLQRNPESALMLARAKMAAGETFEPPATTLWSAAAYLPTRVGGWLFEATHQLDAGRELRAVQALERALRLAAPERLRRPFRGASPQVRQLLRGKRQLTTEHSWLGAGTLDDAYPRPQPRRSAKHDSDANRPAPGPMLETLTEKEREVLGHLAELLTTDEIAGAMFVSVNTVRTHVRNILRKLDASRRNEAVRHARELGIIPGWTTVEPTNGSRTV